MPIYEFNCNECDERFEILFRSFSDKQKPICPKCETRDVTRLMSMFATSSTNKGSSSGKSCGGCSAPSCAGCH